MTIEYWRTSERLKALEQLDVPPASVQPKESAISAALRALERDLSGPDNGEVTNEMDRRIVETARKICSDPKLLEDYHILLDESTLVAHPVDY